jgi:phosphatidylinositol alpha-1,6-mannosyltransferase
VLLSVGRLTRRKGLAEFVAQALPALVRAHPGVVLAVIGGEAENALHGVVGGERQRIEAAAAAAGVASHVRFLDRASDEELRDAYYGSDCHVFPVLDVVGDVEGFGMVALESAAHGLPTVAFAVGGIPDAVEEPTTGTLVPAGDYARFAAAVSSVLGRGEAEREALAIGSQAFADRYSWPKFGQRLAVLLESAMAGGNR